MKKEDKLFVRIDYKVDGMKSNEGIFKEHVEYLQEVSKERYFRGGGFKNKDGGMIILSAADIEEAKRIGDNDPLISKGIYRYEIMEWDVLIASEEMEDE